MPDYTHWFTDEDILTALDATGVTPRTLKRVESVREAVIQQIGFKTLRQFVAGPQGEVRTYDGNGTPLCEVDEMISLSNVTVLGMQNQPGYPLENVTLVYEQGKPYTRLQLAQGSLPAFAPAGVWQPYMAIFPAGRQNVLVTGQYGFAATIPADVWNAGLEQCAAMLTRETFFAVGGAVSEKRQGDTMTQFKLPDVSNPAGWTTEFARVLRDYRRPQGRRLRNLRQRMI